MLGLSSLLTLFLLCALPVHAQYPGGYPGSGATPDSYQMTSQTGG